MRRQSTEILENHASVVLYDTLSGGFEVQVPLGCYISDWAPGCAASSPQLRLLRSSRAWMPREGLHKQPGHVLGAGLIA